LPLLRPGAVLVVVSRCRHGGDLVGRPWQVIDAGLMWNGPVKYGRR
jgi:hypothetical protein